MSPFDAARYARLLEGLEAVESQLSAVSERLDAESQQKSGIALAKKLGASRGVTTIDCVAHVSDGNHLSIAGEFDDEQAGGVRYLRGQDISGEMMLDDRNPVFIPDAEYHKLKRSHIFMGDVLVTIVGANTGQTALVDQAPEKLTANCKLGILRPKNSAIDSAYLHAFLAGRFGQSQIAAAKRGGGQMGLILPDLKALAVARLDAALERQVAELAWNAHRVRRTARQHLEAASTLLMNVLQMSAWQAPEPLTYVRSSRDALAAGRLDAEFFTPRVRALLERLGRDGLTLADVASPRHEAFKPEDAGESFRYIEIGDMRGDGSAGATVLATRDAPSRATQIVRGGDVLTSTVRPIRRLSALVNADQDGAVCSSGFVVLRPEGISGAALLTYLRLPLVCELMNLHTSASLYPAISERDLLGLPIPSISEPTQKAIETQVFAARAARQRATQLLEAAKRAVEIAIEDSEAAALAHLSAVTAADPALDGFSSII